MANVLLPCKYVNPYELGCSLGNDLSFPAFFVRSWGLQDWYSWRCHTVLEVDWELKMLEGYGLHIQPPFYPDTYCGTT